VQRVLESVNENTWQRRAVYA